MAGELPSLAVTVTVTGRGCGSPLAYAKLTALGDAASVAHTAADAAATKHKQSFRARDPGIFILSFALSIIP
jgi:hypothetical protein